MNSKTKDDLLLLLGALAVVAALNIRFQEEFTYETLALPRQEPVQVIWAESKSSSPGIWRAWKDCEGECID